MTKKEMTIVRQIDDLGRIIIPREMRRKIFLHEGDRVEITLTPEGKIILNKFSPIGDIGDFAKEFMDSLYETTGCISIITDRDTIVAVSGAAKHQFLGKTIGKAVEKTIEYKKTLMVNDLDPVCKIDNRIIADDGEYKLKHHIIAPIISQGEVLGTVILATTKNINLIEEKILLAETAASFIAKATQY